MVFISPDDGWCFFVADLHPMRKFLSISLGKTTGGAMFWCLKMVPQMAILGITITEITGTTGFTLW
jgi:hypothetical protein